MTGAENWEAVTSTLQDGTQVEAYQFKEIPEEQQARDDQASRASTDLQRMNVRLRIQPALLEPGSSSPALLQEALAWAKVQPSEAEPSSGEPASTFHSAVEKHQPSPLLLLLTSRWPGIAETTRIAHDIAGSATDDE